MKIGLGPRFSLSFFFGKPPLLLVSVIQSSICCRSASDKRFRLEALLPLSIKPNATRVLLLNGKTRRKDEEEDSLFVFGKAREAERTVDCAGAIFRGKMRW